MKRSYIAGLPALPQTIDGEQPKDILLPLELTQEDLDGFKKTVAGYDFYKISALICPTCGVLNTIQRVVLPDETPKWYLVFRCEHYQKQSTNTEPVAPASDAGSDTASEPQVQNQQPQTQE